MAGVCEHGLAAMWDRPEREGSRGEGGTGQKLGASPPHLWRACPPVDLAKPDHTVSRGPGSKTQPRAKAPGPLGAV
jgi:hypothetical protein